MGGGKERALEHQERLAVLLQHDAQSAKPVTPLRAQMASEPDLVDRRWICVGFCGFAGHCLLPVVAV